MTPVSLPELPGKYFYPSETIPALLVAEKKSKKTVQNWGEIPNTLPLLRVPVDKAVRLFHDGLRGDFKGFEFPKARHV